MIRVVCMVLRIDFDLGESFVIVTGDSTAITTSSRRHLTQIALSSIVKYVLRNSNTTKSRLK